MSGYVANMCLLSDRFYAFVVMVPPIIIPAIVYLANCMWPINTRLVIEILGEKFIAIANQDKKKLESRIKELGNSEPQASEQYIADSTSKHCFRFILYLCVKILLFVALIAFSAVLIVDIIKGNYKFNHFAFKGKYAMFVICDRNIISQSILTNFNYQNGNSLDLFNHHLSATKFNFRCMRTKIRTIMSIILFYICASLFYMVFEILRNLFLIYRISKEVLCTANTTDISRKFIFIKLLYKVMMNVDLDEKKIVTKSNGKTDKKDPEQGNNDSAPSSTTASTESTDKQAMPTQDTPAEINNDAVLQKTPSAPSYAENIDNSAMSAADTLAKIDNCSSPSSTTASTKNKDDLSLLFKPSPTKGRRSS